MTLGTSGSLSHRQVLQAGPQSSTSSPRSPYAPSLLLGTTYCSSLGEGILGSEVQRGQSRSISLFLCGGSHDEVTLPKVREALMNTDPSLDKQTLNSYLSQAFQLPMTELPEEGEEKEEGIVIRLQAALEQLQMSDVRRMGP